MTLIIMAAGMGSRFGGMKQLTPLTDDGEFIIDFTVYDAIRAGFDKFVFIIRREHEALFEEKIGARLRRAGVSVRYAYQEMALPCGYEIPSGRKKPFGTGHAVMSAGKMNEPFAVVNADDFYGKDPLEKICKYMSRSSENEWCMVGYRVKNTLSPNGPVSRGICNVKDGWLETINECKKIERTGDNIVNHAPNGNDDVILPDQLVSMTCFGFTPLFSEQLERLFCEYIEKNKSDLENCEFYLQYAIQSLIDSGAGKMRVLDTDTLWKGVTYKEDSEDFCRFIREEKAKGHYPRSLWQ